MPNALTLRGMYVSSQPWALEERRDTRHAPMEGDPELLKFSNSPDQARSPGAGKVNVSLSASGPLSEKHPSFSDKILL